MNLSEQEKLQKQVDKLQKQLEQEKEKKKNERQYEKDIYKAVEQDLMSTFCRTFEKEGMAKGFLNLSLKITRDEILAHVAESDIEWHWINNNYERILNRTKKIYENDRKAQEELEKLGYHTTLLNNNQFNFELRKMLIDNNCLELAKKYRI